MLKGGKSLQRGGMESAVTLLCDVGNTSYHFFDGETSYKRDVKTFDPASVKDDVAYICVNPAAEEKLTGLENWKNLFACIEWEKYYETMGIDRVMACEAIEEGVVLDAGSAITVDLVKAGRFEGGFIYPGIRAMQGAYASISDRLHYSINFEADLDKMPKNSRDAISYGFLRTLKSEVERHGGPLYLTGGDAGSFASVFPEAVIDELLIFKGMKKMLEQTC
jgi:type III pantothenate kinase